MESFFRLADAVNSMTPSPPRNHHYLGCQVIPTNAIRVFCSFNGSAQDCHTTCRLLRGNEPGNEARVDSLFLCETLTRKINRHFRSCVKIYVHQNPWGTGFANCIPSIKGQLHEITTVSVIYVLHIYR